MPTSLRLAIVGCGGMGHRHLMGLVELQRLGLLTLDLVAACDPVTENAESLARLAKAELGAEPAPVPDLASLAAHGVQAIDITSPPALHHHLIAEAADMGIHVMTEKPVGLTVASSLEICETARSHPDIVISVAENYRRDPINRLARALLAADAIGAPRLLQMNSVSGQNTMMITLWRHMRRLGGILVDMGVHYGDMLEYLLGPVVSMYGQARLHEKERVNLGKSEGVLGNPGGFYAKWQAAMPECFEPDAEDALYGLLNFESGAVAQYTEDHAGWGQPLWERTIFGSEGSMDLTEDRHGQPLTVHRTDGHGASDAAVLNLVPDFRLDPLTARLFGGDRLWTYDMDFTFVDRKLLALEYAELAHAVETGQPVEVDAMQGTRALAVIYGLLESAVEGRLVTMDEVLSGKVSEYQREINESL